MVRLLALFAALVVLPVVAAPSWSAPARAELPPFIKADRVKVVKGERRLYLLRGGSILRAYRVALGRNPRGHKIFEGDGRTPEGSYVLDRRNRGSRFYRSIHISYPNSIDIQQAARWGIPAGGSIMIHGQPSDRPLHSGHTVREDWTEGCIAVTNKEMDEIWAAVDDGTPIEILP